MSHVRRKPVFRVSSRVQHKPGCTGTENGKMLETLDLGSRGIVLSTVKTRALICYTFTAQLICASVLYMQNACFLWLILGLLDSTGLNTLLWPGFQPQKRLVAWWWVSSKVGVFPWVLQFPPSLSRGAP